MTSGPSDKDGAWLEGAIGEALEVEVDAGVDATVGTSLEEGIDDDACSDGETDAPDEQATMRAAAATIGARRAIRRWDDLGSAARLRSSAGASATVRLDSPAVTGQCHSMG